MTTEVNWVEKKYGSESHFHAVVNGLAVTVRRQVVKRSRSYDTPFGRIPGVPKPRRYSSCTLFSISVQVGEEAWEKVPAGDDLRACKARAVAFANNYQA